MGSQCPTGLFDRRFQYALCLIPFETFVADTFRVLDDWNRDALPMNRGDFGVWEVTVPAKDGEPGIPHNTKVKVA